jgi:hypothetical protein
MLALGTPKNGSARMIFTPFSPNLLGMVLFGFSG